MAPRPEPRTEAARQGLKSLRTSAAIVQNNRGLTDTEMSDILGSLHSTYARRAHAAVQAKEATA